MKGAFLILLISESCKQENCILICENTREIWRHMKTDMFRQGWYPTFFLLDVFSSAIIDYLEWND